MKTSAIALLAALLPLAACTGAGGRSDGAWAYYDAGYAGGMEGYDSVPVPYYAAAPAGQPYADPNYYSAQPAPAQPPAYCGYSSQTYHSGGHSSQGDSYGHASQGGSFSSHSYQSGCYYGQPPSPAGDYGPPPPDQNGGYYPPPADQGSTYSQPYPNTQPYPGNGAYGPPDQGSTYALPAPAGGAYTPPPPDTYYPPVQGGGTYGQPYDQYYAQPDHGGAYYSRPLPDHAPYNAPDNGGYYPHPDRDGVYDGQPHADIGHDNPPPHHDGDHVRHHIYRESDDAAPAHDAVKHDRSWYSTYYSFGH